MFGCETVSDFVREWGYLAVFFGSIFEGEVILITASAFAAFGDLNIFRVFLIAFLTTVIVDQLLFWVGYKIGTDWLIAKFPKLEKSREKAFAILRKMDVKFIFAFRFIYGIRTISPIIIGSAKIRPRRFITFNILSGLCWAFVGCFIGYTIADFAVDGKFDSVPTFIAIPLITIIIAGIFTLSIRSNKKD
ncbi:MAG: DedA family protein [Holosporales bacterium]|jgi:membrane protein DedA with SNARE-associated domain|nr:DedA family protein [Holosporales bacterium]